MDTSCTYHCECRPPQTQARAGCQVSSSHLQVDQLVVRLLSDILGQDEVDGVGSGH